MGMYVPVSLLAVVARAAGRLLLPCAFRDQNNLGLTQVILNRSSKENSAVCVPSLQRERSGIGLNIIICKISHELARHL